MRTLLSILLTAGLLLISSWTVGSVFYQKSLGEWSRLARQGVKAATAEIYGVNALGLLDWSLDLDPGNPSYWLERGHLLLRIGYFIPEVASKKSWSDDYQHSIARLPTQDLPLLTLANMCAVEQLPGGHRDFTTCQKLYQATLARHPTYGYAHYKYGDYLYGRSETAEQPDIIIVAEMCREYGLGLRLMSSGLGIGKKEKKTYASCLDMSDSYAVARGIEPFTSRQWELMGLGLGRKGEEAWTESRPQVFSDLTESQGLRDNYVALARGLARAKLPRSGAQVLEYYLVDHPEDAKAWESLVRLMDRHRKIFEEQEIITVLRKAEAASRLDTSTSVFFGHTACKAGDSDLAASFYKKATSLDPENPGILISAGDCLMRLGQHDRGIASYKKAISLDPGKAEWYVRLGRAYASLKKYQAAEEQLERALALSPNHSGAKKVLRRMGIH